MDNVLEVRDHMQMRFMVSYKYLINLKNEIKKKSRNSHAHKKLEHLKEEAEKMLEMSFDMEEVMNKD
jgi:hypothetical protein